MDAPKPTLCVIPGLDATDYVPHDLHSGDRIWVEKNCYADLWIGLLGALGLEPSACLGFTLGVDFLGDQWTFYKPSHDDLFHLYGLDVQELTVWKPILEHAREHLAAGRLIATEADAWWLPDTAGTDYRTKHTKTTVVFNELDESRQRLGYFHNAGYYQLDGEDYEQTFSVGPDAQPPLMPFFAEVIDLRRMTRRSDTELRALAREFVKRALLRRPTDNPVARFAQRYEQDLPLMQERGLGHYHAWAFAATRQLGSAAELAAHHLRWLEPDPQHGFHAAAAELQELALLSKTFILKGARAAASKRAFSDEAILSAMARSWASAFQTIDATMKG